MTLTRTNRKNTRSYMKRRIRHGSLMLLPTMIFVVAFVVIPLIYVGIISFCKWNGSRTVKMKFVGLQNYMRLGNVVGFRDMLIFTFVFAIAVTVLTVLVSLVMALALDIPSYGRYVNRSFLRACWYIPALIGGVAVGVVWRIMYNYNNGVINSILDMMGLAKVNWLETYGVTGIAVIIAQVWVQVGMCIIIFLAGLQSIPLELYESATIDGASKLQQRLKITIPLLAPSITINFVTTSIAAFKAYELPYTISKGLPGYSTHLVTQMIYHYSFEALDYGTGAALSILLVILIAAIQLIQLIILRRREDIY